MAFWRTSRKDPLEPAPEATSHWLPDRLAPDSTPDLGPLKEWVSKQDRPLTVFDLEATKQTPHFTGFGILQVGLLTVLPDGRVFSGEEFVSPERRIPKKVTEITGISAGDVAGHPTWGESWAKVFHRLAAEHWTAGFNSWRYDCAAVRLQNERYGVLSTEFPKDRHIDVYCLPRVGSMKLVDSVKKHALQDVGPAHRALSDARATARLLSLVVGDLSDMQLLKKGVGGGKASAKRSARHDRIESRFLGGDRPSVQALAEEFELAPSTIEADLVGLVKDGRIHAELVADQAVQTLIDTHFAVSIEAVGARGEAVILSGVKDEIQARASTEVDFFEVRIAMIRHAFVFDPETKEYVPRQGPARA